jgi:(1->4)-alpha-D-glucan 1-alpha-D-glucosylmutase
VSARLALTATYRLQMNAGFTLAQACDRVDYFAALGVSHLYLSPILAARKGSLHGYDVIDPARVNPELGTESDLRVLSRELHARGMGLIVDIVPNHMGIGPENAYWDDVLTHGDRSRYARWFDIAWAPHNGRHRQLVLPVLGAELDEVLKRGELSITLVEGETPRVAYFAHSFPLDPASLPPELQLAQVDPEEAAELADAYAGPTGRDRFRALLDAQHYQLVFWRRGQTEINYRRFFDVDDLAALRVDDPAVFDETHELILRLVRDGVIDGLRVDHIDGLLDPAAYLARLRAAVPPATLLFVEKILSPDERLPREWPVHGTTGYEFLNDLGDLFIEPTGFAEVETAYRRLRRLGDTHFADAARAGKRKILSASLQADLGRLVMLLAPMARARGARWTTEVLTNALVEFIVALPVYRTYIAADGNVSATDRAVTETAVREAQAVSPDPIVVGFIGDVVLGADTSIQAPARLAFVHRLQQLTGPATAKGIEDTALYLYIPLVSRNEVGGAPDRPLDDAVARLHEANQRRAEAWPLALLATNTHDTKRSADIRDRLAVISEIPHEWDRSIRRWRRLNAKHRRTIKGRLAPDTNAEYLVYQTLIALWPPPRAGRRIDDLPDRAWRDAARDRVVAYMLKAARETKLRTSWIDPDVPYENALTHFVAALLEPSDDAPFLTDVARFAARIATAGAANALARVAIHLTAPGTPDLYQGDELWNFSLVDPDNRRPVDYDARAAMLATLADLEQRIVDSELAELFDDRVKLLLTHRLLHARRTHAQLFAAGAYRPLTVRGARARHVVAFARSFERHHAITIVPRFVASQLPATARDWWADTAIELPHDLVTVDWRSPILSGEAQPATHTLLLAKTLEKLPVAVLLN